jgi:hypothetical protein
MSYEKSLEMKITRTKHLVSFYDNSVGKENYERKNV